jgi:hypothetical protein
MGRLRSPLLHALRCSFGEGWVDRDLSGRRFTADDTAREIAQQAVCGTAPWPHTAQRRGVCEARRTDRVARRGKEGANNVYGPSPARGSRQYRRRPVRSYDPDHGSSDHRSAWTPSNPRPGIVSPAGLALRNAAVTSSRLACIQLRHGSQWRVRSGSTEQLPCRPSATGRASDQRRYFFTHLLLSLHL